MKAFHVLALLLFANSASSNILLPCEVNEDCSAVAEGATCSVILGGYCTCEAGYTFSTDVSRCLKEASYGETCAEAIQCSHMLTGAQCNGVCGCADGLTYARGRCRKLVNLSEPCRDEIDCFFGYNRESVECRDGTCQCADGFYQRFTNVCRRQSINGESCILNDDCHEEGSTCTGSSGEKKCTTSTVATQTLSVANAAVQTTHSLESVIIDSPFQLGKSSSFSTRRIRNYIKYNKLDNSDATRLSSNDDENNLFGESCESEHKPCPGLKYSTCRRGFCQCQDGFFQRDGICKAELGELVEDETFCGAGDTFRDNRCTCRNDRFYLPNMRSCIKAADGINQSCTQPSQCTPYGAAFCPVEHPRRCTCYEYARYNPVTEKCEMKEEIGEFCERTETCKIKNTVCTTQNTCECKSNYVAQNDNECKPGYTAECEVTEDCAFENAECKVEIVDEKETKKCHCKDDFVGIGNACFEKAKSYNDTCTENDQCKPLLGDKATCNENQCTCDETLHFKDGQCNDKKELSERCGKNSDCFEPVDPESVECRNGVCQCKFKYTADANQNRCVVRPREKNSSKSTSPLKVVTLMLIASAVVITGSALKDAYYP